MPKNGFYAEYHSKGPGANHVSRVSWSHQLTQTEAKEYTPGNILKGKDNWNFKKFKIISRSSANMLSYDKNFRILLLTAIFVAFQMLLKPRMSLAFRVLKVSEDTPPEDAAVKFIS